MKKNYVLYLGRNIPNTKQEVSLENFVEFLNSQSLLQSFTIFDAKGFWHGEFEKTFVIEVFGIEPEKIDQFAELYCTTFDQEDVLIKEINVNVNLLRGELHE